MTKVVQEDNSPAQATLHPQNKSTMLNAALLKLSGMSVEDLSHFLNDTLAQIGHEADGVGNVSSSNQNTLNMHPSAASTSMKESAAEDLALILGEGEELSEEVRSSITTVFESVVEARLVLEKEALVEEAEKKLEEAYTSMHEEMEQTVNAYLDSVIKEWLSDNEVAIESSLRNELTDDFIEGLKQLFSEHYMHVPEDKVDVVEELVSKVSALEEQVDGYITENAALKQEALSAKKNDVVNSVCEGLALTSAEKLRSLVETIEFDGDLEAFTNKVNVLKESVTASANKQTSATGILTEESDPEAAAGTNKAPTYSPDVARYMSSISRSVRSF